MKIFAPFCAALLVANAAGADPGYIWIEGEAPSESTMHRHPWWYDKVKRDALSGGDWISNFDKDHEGVATYKFDVPAPGDYTLWVRANPAVHARLSWQLGGGPWNEIDFKDARGTQNIAADNKPDLRFLAWTKAGRVPLRSGPHAIVWKIHSGAEFTNHGGIDCFVFTRIPFVPQGAQKPTTLTAAGKPDEWFPLLADEDTFDPRSVIDMSRLVPAPAGQLGFLHAAGDKLKFEKSPVPAKFWGVNANVEPGRYTRTQLAQRAKLLRKFGINAVRQHAVFDELNTNGKIDPRKLDEYDWWFAELKKNGIHTDWSVFYRFTIGPGGYPRELYDELEGTPDRKDTYGIITTSPELWAIRNRTLAALLTHKNPYTGLRYVDDPALISVEMQNEDSVFFWNPLGWLAEGKKMPLHSKKLRGQFAAWVKAKYKTDAALAASWGPLRDGDSVDAAELNLMSPWELDGPGPRGRYSGQPKRAGDFIGFLTELQRGLFKSGLETMRAAGFKAVTITTAWQVGGAATEAANIYTDTVGDMIDRHNYAGGGEGIHGIREGAVNNESHLAAPGGGIFTIAMRQVEDKPFSVTEWTQSPPNQWKAEAAPLLAFYGMGLQGWDASWHFIQSGTRLGDGWPGMSSYATSTPHYLGQFPALAFALYRGHIAEAPVVAARRLSKDALFSGVDALKQDATKGGADAKTLIVKGGTPLEVFAIGRVTVGFDSDKTTNWDLSKYWDQPARTIRSATDELTWDYGRQLVTVNSPKTEAVVGRPGDQPITLRGVTAKFRTPFVSTIFTPLDDLPLAASRRILITALARDQQTGTRYNADGTRLEAAGTAPLLLEPVQATIRLIGAKPEHVVPCDPYGVPMPGKTLPIAADGSFTIDGTWRAYYYYVTR